MSDQVTLTRDGDIAVVTVNNPPVNALGTAVRQGLFAAMEQVDADDAIKAAIIIGSGRTFPAGADIREFGQSPQPPALWEVCTRIEETTKPVIAALHGTALGGGLEISLGAHYRIADPKARVGLPEVLIGVMPGAGGTIRLPRLIGHSRAMDLILTGRAVDAQEALQMGLANRLVEDGEALAGAIELATLLARFPQNCLRSDRLSAYEQWGLSLEDALANEFRRGLEVIGSRETVAGATRFAQGKGRHGDFGDI